MANEYTEKELLSCYFGVPCELTSTGEFLSCTGKMQVAGTLRGNGGYYNNKTGAMYYCYIATGPAIEGMRELLARLGCERKVEG